jgi:hypothetical protein
MPGRAYGPTACPSAASCSEGTKRSAISADLEDGLLEVTVVEGCAAQREPERIDIRVSGGDEG